MPPDPKPLGILLLAGTHERAHYAFMLATAAAAIGRPVHLFATNHGLHALSTDWSALQGAANDATIQTTGVAGLNELRAAAADLGVHLMACDAGLRMAGLTPESLLPGVEIAGIPTFLSATGAGQLLAL